MKHLKGILGVVIGIGLAYAGVAFAVSISVPSAPVGTQGNTLVSTSTGAYVVASTTELHADTFPGSDMGAKINAAYAALPATGGRIIVPYGSYSFSTPIVFGTNRKIVYLYCTSGGGASNNAVGGTTLTYTPSTGNAITVNTNNYIVGGSGIENCNIQGTNGTTARSTVGVSEGGGNGAFSFALIGVNVSGFGTGVQWNSNTSFNMIDRSSIHFNGRNVDEPDTSGANCENMRISNSVIADSNNQAGGVTDLFGLAVQESGNCQMNIVNTSFDDNQIYVNQFGGTANVWTLTNVHFENPNQHTYNYIDTLANVPATEVNLIGGDMMNDVVAGMPSYISMGGDLHMDGTTIDGNNNVTTPVTRIASLDNSSNNATISWVGLKNNGKGATYVYNNVPFSPYGYGTGLGDTSFYIGSSSPLRSGFVGIGTSSDIYGGWAKLAVQLNSANDAYSNAFAIGSSTGTATTTLFSISNTGSIFTQLANGCISAASGILTSSGSSCGSGGSSFGKSWEIIAGLFGANVLSPTTTIPIYVPGTGTSTIANTAGVLDASAFAGADMGAKINTAYAAAVPGTTITVPTGTYSVATTINFGTAGKGITLNCAIGTQLNYTGSGDLIDVNVGQTNGANSSINNCHLYGSGTTTASVALRLGGSNGARNFTLNNSQIENFGSTTSSGAITTGANTYIINFNNDFIHHNGKNYYDGSASNAGENIYFTGGTLADCKPIADNCVDFPTASTASVSFTNVSIVDAQVHIGSIVRAVNCTNGHMENPAADNIPKYTFIKIDSSSFTNVTVNGTAFLNGANTQRPTQFISNGAFLTVVAATTEDYGGGAKGVTNFITNTGNGWTKVSSINKQDSAYTNLWASTGGTGTLDYSQEDNGELGIGHNIYLTSTAGESGLFFNAVNTSLPGIKKDASNNVEFVANNAINAQDQTYFAPTGFWGIGSSTPSAKLTIQSNAVGSNAQYMFLIASSSITGTASSTLFSVSNIGSTTLASTFGTCSGTNALTTNSSGTIVCGAITGSGGGSVGNWFTPSTFGTSAVNATSTLIKFNTGIASVASSTIGDGTQIGGLTISGGATTTGVAYFGGGMKIATLLNCNPSNSNQALTTDANGLLSCNTVNNTGAFPFTPSALGNSTSTLIIDTAGMLSTASTTIGNGTIAGGLTVSGGATTTATSTLGGVFIPTDVLQIGTKKQQTLSQFAIDQTNLTGGTTTIYWSNDNGATGTGGSGGDSVSLFASLSGTFGNTNVGGSLSFSRTNVGGSGTTDFLIRTTNGTTMTDRLRILGNNGNVGIASTSPNGKLTVLTAASSTPNLILDATSNGGCIIVKDTTGGTYTELYTQGGSLLSKVATSLLACN